MEEKIVNNFKRSLFLRFNTNFQLTFSKAVEFIRKVNSF